MRVWLAVVGGITALVLSAPGAARATGGFENCAEVGLVTYVMVCAPQDGPVSAPDPSAS